MRANHLVVVPFLAVATLGACGGATSAGGPAGSNSVTGTVAGTPLTVASVVAAPGWSSESGACTVSEADGGDVTCPSSFSRSVSVVFTNRSDATCAAIQSDVASNTTFEYANFDYLAVSVNVANGDVVAGTYEIVASQSSNVTGAAASFVTTSSTCVATPLSATTGTVTLTQVSASSVAGTYNATFGAQGTFQGSFDTAICVFDAGSASTPAKQICQP